MWFWLQHTGYSQQILNKQYRQALLKAKYCPRVGAFAFVGSNMTFHESRQTGSSNITHTKNTQEPIWPWPLTDDLDIQHASRGCQGTGSCKIPPSSGQRFMSYRVQTVLTMLKTILHMLQRAVRNKTKYSEYLNWHFHFRYMWMHCADKSI